MATFYTIMLDLILVIIFIVSIWFGVKKGFLATLLSMVSWILSFIAALMFSSFLAGFVYDAYIGPNIEKGMASSLSEVTNSNELTQGINEQINTLPAYVKKTLYEAFPDLNSTIEKYVDEDSKQIPSLISKDIIRPIISGLLGVVLFLLLFIVFSLVMRMVCRLFSGKIRIPVIGLLNSLLGGVLGAVKGIILVIVAVLICEIIIVGTNNSLKILNKEVTSGTYFYQTINNLSPFNHIDDVK